MGAPNTTDLLRRIEALEMQIKQLKTDAVVLKRQDEYRRGINEKDITARMTLYYGELPEASETYRGEIWTVPGETGYADCPYICIKDADDNYHWFTLLTVL